MKHKFYFLAFASALALCILALSFRAPVAAPEAVELGYTKDATGEVYFAPSGSFYERLYTLDTITNAANDTLYLPSNMRPLFSDFQMAVNILRTNISGTTALAVKVEETNWPYSGSTPPTNGWVATLNSAGTAAATAATTATTEQLLIPHAYGINFRVIVDGSGTQVSSYRLRWTLKKN
jgi:hypothetical protein